MPPRDTLYAIADLYIELTRALAAAGPMRMDRFGVRADLLLIRAAVYLGTADGRPMTAGKLAGYLGIPRATLVRKLRMLERSGNVEHDGHHFTTPRRRLDEVARSDFGNIVRLIREASARLATPD